MTQFMIDAMVMMMPYMKPVAYAGFGAGGLALILGLAHRLSGAAGGLAAFLAKLALAIGIFFLASEIAGRLLGMEPTLLFAADPFDRELYRNQWPFWAVGLATMLVGLAAKPLARA